MRLFGLSVDPLTSHRKQEGEIEQTQGHKVNYPMIGNPELKIAKLYGTLPADAGNTSEGRSALTNATVRTVFVIAPDKKIKLMLSYPMTTRHNFDEVLRVLDSIQLTARYEVATPANWKQGDDVIILPYGVGGRGQAEISSRLESTDALSSYRAAAESGMIICEVWKSISGWCDGH